MLPGTASWGAQSRPTHRALNRTASSYGLQQVTFGGQKTTRAHSLAASHAAPVVAWPVPSCRLDRGCATGAPVVRFRAGGAVAASASLGENQNLCSEPQPPPGVQLLQACHVSSLVSPAPPGEDYARGLATSTLVLNSMFRLLGVAAEPWTPDCSPGADSAGLGVELASSHDAEQHSVPQPDGDGGDGAGHGKGSERGRGGDDGRDGSNWLPPHLLLPLLAVLVAAAASLLAVRLRMLQPGRAVTATRTAMRAILMAAARTATMQPQSAASSGPVAPARVRLPRPQPLPDGMLLPWTATPLVKPPHYRSAPAAPAVTRAAVAAPVPATQVVPTTALQQPPLQQCAAVPATAALSPAKAEPCPAAVCNGLKNSSKQANAHVLAPCTPRLAREPMPQPRPAAGQQPAFPHARPAAAPYVPKPMPEVPDFTPQIQAMGRVCDGLGRMIVSVRQMRSTLEHAPSALGRSHAGTLAAGAV